MTLISEQVGFYIFMYNLSFHNLNVVRLSVVRQISYIIETAFLNHSSHIPPGPSDWSLMNGDLKWIEVGAGKIVALSKNEEVFCRIGIDEQSPSGKKWKHIPFDGKMRQVS